MKRSLDRSYRGCYLDANYQEVQIITISKPKLEYMRWIRRLSLVKNKSKKHCRSFFWRMRAATKRAIKKGRKKRINFQYDPWSYALNFDDGYPRETDVVTLFNLRSHAHVKNLNRFKF